MFKYPEIIISSSAVSLWSSVLAFSLACSAFLAPTKAIVIPGCANVHKRTSCPIVSGDGYYEFETLDPENNRIEVVAAVNNKSDK